MNGEGAEEQSPGGQRSAEIINSLLTTPKPITALISGEKGSSSVVKYKVTTTPGYVDTSPSQCNWRPSANCWDKTSLATK